MSESSVSLASGQTEQPQIESAGSKPSIFNKIKYAFSKSKNLTPSSSEIVKDVKAETRKSSHVNGNRFIKIPKDMLKANKGVKKDFSRESKINIKLNKNLEKLGATAENKQKFDSIKDEIESKKQVGYQENLEKFEHESENFQQEIIGGLKDGSISSDDLFKILKDMCKGHKDVKALGEQAVGKLLNEIVQNSDTIGDAALSGATRFMASRKQPQLGNIAICLNQLVNGGLNNAKMSNILKAIQPFRRLSASKLGGNTKSLSLIRNLIHSFAIRLAGTKSDELKPRDTTKVISFLLDPRNKFGLEKSEYRQFAYSVLTVSSQSGCDLAAYDVNRLIKNFRPQKKEECFAVFAKTLTGEIADICTAFKDNINIFSILTLNNLVDENTEQTVKALKDKVALLGLYRPTTKHKFELLQAKSDLKTAESNEQIQNLKQQIASVNSELGSAKSNLQSGIELNLQKIDHNAKMTQEQLNLIEKNIQQNQDLINQQMGSHNMVMRELNNELQDAYKELSEIKEKYAGDQEKLQEKLQGQSDYISDLQNKLLACQQEFKGLENVQIKNYEDLKNFKEHVDQNAQEQKKQIEKENNRIFNDLNKLNVEIKEQHVRAHKEINNLLGEHDRAIKLLDLDQKAESAKNNAEMLIVQKQLQLHNKLINANAEGLEAQSKVIANQEKQIQEIDNQVNIQGNAIQEQGQQISNLTKEVQKINSRLGDVETDMGKVDVALQDIQSGAEDMNVQINSLWDNVKEQGSGLSSLQGMVDDLFEWRNGQDQKLQNVFKFLDENKQEIENLSKNCAEMKDLSAQDKTELESKINQMQKDWYSKLRECVSAQTNMISNQANMRNDIIAYLKKEIQTSNSDNAAKLRQELETQKKHMYRERYIDDTAINALGKDSSSSDIKNYLQQYEQNYAEEMQKFDKLAEAANKDIRLENGMQHGSVASANFGVNNQIRWKEVLDCIQSLKSQLEEHIDTLKKGLSSALLRANMKDGASIEEVSKHLRKMEDYVKLHEENIGICGHNKELVYSKNTRLAMKNQINQ